MGALAVRAASVGHLPDQPGRPRCGYLLGDSGAKVIVAEDQEQVDKTLAVLDELPGPRSGSSTSSRAASGTATTTRKLMSWEEFLELGREHRAQHPTRWPTSLAGQRPDDLATLVYTSGTTGPPKGAMLTRRQRRVRDPGPGRGGRVHRPAARPATTCCCPTCRSPTSPSGSSRPGSTPAPAPRSTSPSRSRRCPQNLREVQPTILFGVPRIWEKLLAGVEIRLSGASWLKRKVAGVLARRRRPASAATWSPTAARTRPAPGSATRVGYVVLLPRAQGPARACARSGTPPPVRRRSRPRCCGSSWASGCRCTRSTA